MNLNQKKGIQNHMSTSLSIDPFHGLRLFEDAVTRLMSEPRDGTAMVARRGHHETEDALR